MYTCISFLSTCSVRSTLVDTENTNPGLTEFASSEKNVEDNELDMTVQERSGCCGLHSQGHTQAVRSQKPPGGHTQPETGSISRTFKNEP